MAQTQNSSVSAALTDINPDNFSSQATNYNVEHLPTKISGIMDPFYSDTFVGADQVFAWGKLFPYELMILKADDAGGLTKESSFVLPIPPQEMTIQTPFAINQTVTMGGVVEEHNSAPIRIIQMSGTTGVAPLRLKASDDPPKPPMMKLIMDTIFMADKAVASTYLSELPMAGNQGVANGSGYNQFRILQNFLEGYALSKKKKENRNLRLGLAIWKEGVVYLVTPMAFNVRRTVSSPLEYLYDLQFRAFARKPIEIIGASDTSETNPKNDLNYLQKALNLLRNARSVVAMVVKAIRNVRAAVQQVMEVVRQSILFIKDAIGAIIELIELPSRLVQDFKRLIVGAWDDLQAATLELQNINKTELSRVRNTAQTASVAPGDPVASTLDDVFANPDNYSAFFEKCPLDSFRVDAHIQQKIDAELTKVRKLTPSDYSAFRSLTIETMLDLANVLGVGDSTVDSVYGISEPQTTRTLTTQELNLLGALNDIADGFALMAMRRPYDQLTSVDYMAGYAAASGIAFTNPVSKFAVPMPYDMTLDQLSMKYLKDPDRWVEIAAINGLKDPFIDEVGFQQYLSADGSGNKVIVSDASKYNVRQAVWVGSVLVPREKRHILSIDKLGTAFILTLDGADDLAKYKLAADAYLHSFLPDTVNSMQSIFIPSDQQGVLADEITRVPGVDMFDPLLKAGGIDLMVDQNGDLIITQDGDCRMAYGMQGIEQRIRLTIATPRGALMHHPGFGFPIQPGVSISDMSAQAMAESIRTMFGDDPLFNNLSNIKVSVKGPTAYVSMGITVQGEDRPIDVSIAVMR
jgi:hypothetical protein